MFTMIPGRRARGMRSCVLAGAAFFASFFLILPGSASAQQQITVTATRTPVRVAEVLADITVIDRSLLDRSEARSLVELLSKQAGLQFASNGGLGKTASLFIRGLEARHTLLLVDGVRVGSATVGSPSLDNLPLELVERIEIVRGPMSSLYGNGALGGVIQVFTRRAGQGWGGNAKLAAGSHQHRQAGGGLSFGDAVFDAALQLQHTDVKGVSASNPQAPFGNFNGDADGLRQTGASLRLGWQMAPAWRLELMSWQSRGLTRLDDGVGAGAGADARAELDNRNVALTARGLVMPGWSTRVTVANATDAYNTLASASAFAALGVIQTRSRQAAWENTVDTPVGQALALLERSSEKVSRPGQPFALSERDIDAVALGLNGSLAAHSWQASLRRDQNSQFGGVTTGALAYGYALSPAWRVGASFGTSQTLPSFNQLYFPNFGSPTLQPEKGRHGELSLRWTAAEHSLRAALYDYRYRGFIPSGPQPANLPQVEVEGLTLAYEGRWQGLDLQASLDHTDPRNATTGNANQGKQLQRRAKQALRWGLDHDAGRWSAGASMVAFSHRFENAANTQRLGGYATLDLRGDVELAPGLKLGLRLNNIADKRYETVLGYNQPGREAFVTLRQVWR